MNINGLAKDNLRVSVIGDLFRDHSDQFMLGSSLHLRFDFHFLLNLWGYPCFGIGQEEA